MAALANVLLSSLSANNSVYQTNSATVGVDRTFSPERFLPGGTAKWVDRSGGVALGFPSLMLRVRPPVGDFRVYRVKQDIILPTLETVDPATGIFGPKFGYQIEAHLDFLLHERSTTAERTVLFNLVRSSMFALVNASDGAPTDGTGAPIANAVINFEDVF